MSHEELERHIMRLRNELDLEREERNFFQLERDKINTFFEITKQQLSDKVSELRSKERETEEAEERHQMELKVSSDALVIFRSINKKSNTYYLSTKTIQLNQRQN